MEKNYFTDADTVDCGCGTSRIYDFDGIVHGTAHFWSGADDDDANLFIEDEWQLGYGCYSIDDIIICINFIFNHHEMVPK